MSEILVLVDHGHGKPNKISLQMLTAASKIAGETGDSVSAVWLGEGAGDHAAALGAHGATKLYHWDSADADAYVTLPKVEALQKLVEDNDVSAVFFASSNHTKDVAARLGIRVDGGVITDVSDLAVEDDRYLERRLEPDARCQVMHFPRIGRVHQKTRPGAIDTEAPADHRVVRRQDRPDDGMPVAGRPCQFAQVLAADAVAVRWDGTGRLVGQPGCPLTFWQRN